MVNNYSQLIISRNIPDLSMRRHGCYDVRQWIIDPFLIIWIVGHFSCSMDRSHIVEFLIFESQMCRSCEPITANVALETTSDRQLPCISKWHLKASKFSWCLLWHLKLHRWIFMQWLLRLMFGTFMSSWLPLCGFASFDDYSVAVLFQPRFICSISYCVLLSFTAFFITRAVNCLSKWVMYKVLPSWCAVHISAKCILATGSLQECLRGCGVKT